MSINHTKISQRLQLALLKQFNIVILLEKEQFYSEKQHRTITMYVVSQRLYDDEKERYVKKQLLKTADGVGMMKFLAEMYKQEKEKQMESYTERGTNERENTG
jgi:HD superfamily phosphodiesterase